MGFLSLGMASAEEGCVLCCGAPVLGAEVEESGDGYRQRQRQNGRHGALKGRVSCVRRQPCLQEGACV